MPPNLREEYIQRKWSKLATFNAVLNSVLGSIVSVVSYSAARSAILRHVQLQRLVHPPNAPGDGKHENLERRRRDWRRLRVGIRNQTIPGDVSWEVNERRGRHPAGS